MEAETDGIADKAVLLNYSRQKKLGIKGTGPSQVTGEKTRLGKNIGTEGKNRVKPANIYTKDWLFTEHIWSWTSALQFTSNVLI